MNLKYRDKKSAQLSDQSNTFLALSANIFPSDQIRGGYK